MLEGLKSIVCQFVDKHKDMPDAMRKIHLNREYAKKADKNYAG